jgi:hypothetical protein
MKNSASFLLAGFLLSACSGGETPETGIADAPTSIAADWDTLFAGDNFDQFIQVGDGNWQIIDDYAESQGMSHGYLVSKDSYSDFDLHVEFWPGSDANSGVFMRCENSTEIVNEKCYELNIMDEHPKRSNATGSIINLAPPMQEIETAGQWNAFDISARGDHIVVELNGTVVIDFRDQTFSNGPIGLQSKTGLIRFKNIRVRPVPTSGEI